MTTPVACPHCGGGIRPSDAFCEACGGRLVVDPAAAAVSSAPEHQRTHFVTAPSMQTADFGPCIACGATIADDGFCSRCGQRPRSPREHWVESPSDWVGGVCDKGISHAGNEDAMALASTPDRSFAALVVCDGVTTAPQSDRASMAASKAACALLAAVPRNAGSAAARVSAWRTVLDEACSAANAEAVGVARTLGDPPEPPSCTFVAGVVDVDLVAVAWCGDSRAYWIADAGEGSEQLSIDHSLGTEMILAGMLREHAEADSTSHTITRWLGADSIDPTPEFRSRPIDAPGWLLVVSDGMWNYASSTDELASLIARATADGASTPTTIAESLAAFANDRGGRDNITVALARCEPPLL